MPTKGLPKELCTHGPGPEVAVDAHAQGASAAAASAPLVLSLRDAQAGVLTGQHGPHEHQQDKQWNAD